MKTPEQMAEEHAKLRCPEQGPEFIVWCMCRDDFLAGYHTAINDLSKNEKYRFCVYCNDFHLGNCAEGRGKNHPALRGTQWISVKERLPEENDEVLIYTDRKHIYMARIYKGNEAYPISNGCGCCGSEERYTHWMPLPEPPEK